MFEQTEWNVVFLLDQDPPSKIVMLKRSDKKSFAPNFYTGVGGKVDLEDKSILDSAYRELMEETGIKGIELTEFARCITDNKYIIYYFWGIYQNDKLPFTEDGTLEWVKKEDILDREIIPTTQLVCQEWLNRDLKIDKPFTTYVKEVGMNGTVKVVELEQVKEELGRI